MQLLILAQCQMLISIHALVKRATQAQISLPVIWVISIHALVKRATSGKHGCNDFFDISIHALVKRATMTPIS